MRMIIRAFQAVALMTLPSSMVHAMHGDPLLPKETDKSSTPSASTTSSTPTTVLSPPTLPPLSSADATKKSSSTTSVSTPIKTEDAFSSDSEEEDEVSLTKKKRVYDLPSIKFHAEKALGEITRSKTRFEPRNAEKVNTYYLVSLFCEAWGGKGLDWLAHSCKYTYVKKMAQDLGEPKEDMLAQIRDYISSNPISAKDDVVKILPGALKYIETKLDPKRS